MPIEKLEPGHIAVAALVAAFARQRLALGASISRTAVNNDGKPEYRGRSAMLARFKRADRRRGVKIGWYG